MNLHWHGPYGALEIIEGKFHGAESSGCYVWYVPLAEGLQPFYVGMTGKRKLRQRLAEHFTKQLGGEYRCVDVKKLRAGKRWHRAQVYEWDKNACSMNFLRNWTRLGSQSYETLKESRFYFAVMLPTLASDVEKVLIRSYLSKGFKLANTRTPRKVPTIQINHLGVPQIRDDLGPRSGASA